ncbi:hypothetical protein RI367_003396 [Sorochytrium milnesiophthora]
MDIGDSPATDPLQQLPNTESRPFLLGCYSFDLAFSVGIVVTQSFNIRRTQQFFSKVKSFSAWLTAIHMCGFVSGVVGGAVCIAYAALHLGDIHYAQSRVWIDQAMETCVTLQFAFQAVAIVQRVHIVNKYAVDNEVITLREFVRKRWPELGLGVWTVAVLTVIYVYGGSALEYEAGVGSLLLVIVLDLGVSLATFNKVHRMLNTGERTLSWYMRALLPLPSQATLDRAGSVASNNTNNSSSNIAPGRTGHAMSADTRRVLRSWTMMTVGVISSALIFFFAWLFLTRSQAWVTAFRLFWLAGCIWQRGSLLYIDAIRHVAISNRASKRYLGTMTTTGIVFDTIKRRTSPVPEPKQAQENKS